VRGTFIDVLCDIAERDARVLLLTGDLGYTVVEPFVRRFPSQFLNAGVAEQNMVGLATGLAEAGFIPFVYSIATFASLRPYEFIRNGPIVHDQPVRIVGVGTGFAYGSAGISHYALEDVAIMRAQPHMRVICPADDAQAARALYATWELPGPCYYALSRDSRAEIPGLGGRFELGCAHEVGTGADLLLIAMGSVAAEASAAAAALKQHGVNCTLLVVSSVSPPPLNDLAEALGRFRTALTIEAHYVSGGLGSLVAEVIAEHGIACQITRCGVRSMPVGPTGSERFLLEQHGLSCKGLVETALGALGRRSNG
jgi:transketolase